MHSTRDPISLHTPQNTAEGASLDIGAWASYLWEKKWIFFWSALISGALGYLVCLSLQPQYTATATVLVQDPPNTIPGQTSSAIKDTYAAPEALKAVEGSFKNETLLLRLVKVNHLDLTHPAFQAKPSDPPMNDAKLIEIMQKRFSAKAQRGSRLIDIAVSDEDPALAQKLTQSAVDEYVKLMYGFSGHVVAIANSELEKQADEIRVRLEKSEQALQSYREKYDTTSIEEKKNLSVEKLRQLSQQLTDVKGNRIRLESQLGGLTDVDRAPVSRLIGIQSIASQPDVGLLQKSLNDAQAQMAVAEKTYGPLHPGYTSMRGAVDSVRAQLSAVVHNYGRALRNDYRAAKAAEASLTQQMSTVDTESVTLAGISIPYSMLEREEQANKLMYDQLLERMRQNKVEQNVNQMNIQQVQNATLPNINEPDKPRVLLLVAVAVILGLGLASLYVIFRRVTDSSFRSVEEAEQYLQMPMLSVIRAADFKKSKKKKELTLLQATAPASAQAESIRALRTALTFLPDGQPHTVMFTSSVPGEGKSFCAANYAIALAQQGLKTLLVDGDLRRPTLMDLFPDVRAERGLADYLAGTVSLPDICHPTQIKNLSFLSAGKQRSRPTELLARKEEVQNLFRSLENFDCVVIDSAPVLAVSDPLLLVPFAEAVVLIVKARKTQQKEIARSLQLFDQAGVQLSGFVLNQMLKPQTYSYSEYAGEYSDQLR